MGDICLVPPLPPHAIDWEQVAALVTFYLDPFLLMNAAPALIPGATGELVWIRLEENTESLTASAHPAFIIYTDHKLAHADRVEIVLHVTARDPLRQHIALVLKAELESEGVVGRLYAESLTNALAVHFLRRYVASRQTMREFTGGLPPYKLHRVTTYIEEHLEKNLSLAELAKVGQMSPDHFAHLFKQTTGLAPHQYVVACRIERAKRLLAETDLPLIEISQQVGWGDQSSFTALFRTHVAMTPKAYRDTTKK